MDGVNIFLAVLTVIFVIVGIFLWSSSEIVATSFSRDFVSSYTNEKDKLEILNDIKLLGGFIFLFSTGFIAYLFMIGFNPIKIHDKLSSGNQQDFDLSEKKEILKLLISMNSTIEKGKLESILSDKEREQIISSISETVEKQLNDSLLERIESKYGTVIYKDKLSNKAEVLLNSTIERLYKYNEDLKRKASVNLIYGILSTIGAIMILIFVLVKVDVPEFKSQIDTVFFYTSRLFLVLLVQGISIFFLNLYKSTLNNILYINNEITNHESKRDALILSLSGGNDDNISKILATLSSTERNFVLKKGETSIFDNGGQQLETPIPASVVSDLLKKMGQ